MEIALFVSVLVGIALVIFSLILPKTEPPKESKQLPAINAEKTVELSIIQAEKSIEKSIEEFDKMSREVFEQLDQKYQELLFLYSLIDEKKSEIANLYSETSKIQQLPVLKPEKQEVIVSSPKHQEVKKLVQKGHDISEIAKMLGIGQGEVKLILDLGKTR